MKNNLNIARELRCTILICFLGLMCSCKKFIEVKAPVTNINAGNVYEDDTNAAAVLTGLYANMVANEFSFNLSVYPELSADNVILFDQNDNTAKAFYQNALNSEFSGGGLWNNIYTNIYVVNAAIEGLNSSTHLTPAIKSRLLGESYFMRGFYYFYLVNLYGELPLVLSTDYKVNSLLARSSINAIYGQIINDLKTSQGLLDNRYMNGAVTGATNDRVRPNRAAATALLARIYLYSKNYAEAQIQSSEVIQQSAMYAMASDLDAVFLKGSTETIWALQPVNAGYTIPEGFHYIIIGNGNGESGMVYFNNDFLNSFDNGDQRRVKWVGNQVINLKLYTYPFKYKVKTNSQTRAEYITVLRLAEQYLIRAEAKIQNDDIAGGVADLNVLRARATDQNAVPADRLKQLSITLSKQEALNAVERERRSELFTEWGNRWFDLKRTNRVNEVMQVATPPKGGVWTPFRSLYPIPIGDIRSCPNLVQNPGYK